MFVDELTINAKAGDGGDGVVRWRHEKFKPKAGPAGGNGGKGGDVYIRGVKDLSILGKYVGTKGFFAENGEPGRGKGQHGHAGKDVTIDLPVGATVTDVSRGRTHRLESPGEQVRILTGGVGGLGNEHFKSSTNRSPRERTTGKPGEAGEFQVELSLLVDAGLVGLPNAGKSTLLNTITNAKTAVGAYPFTTLEPHLGDLYGFVLADIPGLIEGASTGKGLGYKFLRHIRRTKMLLHVISLEEPDPVDAYRTVRNELEAFDPALLKKEEWVVLTKTDTVTRDLVQEMTGVFKAETEAVFAVSAHTGKGVKEFQDALVHALREKERSKTSEEDA